MLDADELDPRVRLASPKDEDALVDAVRDMHAGGEWGWRYSSGDPLAFSEAKTRQTVQTAIKPRTRNTPDAAQSWIGIVGEDSAVEGCACLYIGNMFCSEDPILFEQWSFVLPDYRRSDNARLLITFATAMSRVLRLPLVIGTMSHVRTDAKSRLYERSFGRPLGTLYLYHGDEQLAGAAA